MTGRDYEEILTLEHRFIEHLDDDDLDAVAALFTHGSLELVIDGTDVAARGTGVRGVADVLRSVARPRPAGSFGRHLVSNAIVDVDDAAGTAAVRFRTVLHYVVPGRPLHVLGLGRHEDELVRVDGVWRIARKRILGDVRYPPPAGS